MKKFIFVAFFFYALIPNKSFALSEYTVPNDTRAFLEKLVEVAKHGDLKDIEFTNKTLGLHVTGKNGEPSFEDAENSIFKDHPQKFSRFNFYYTFKNPPLPMPPPYFGGQSPFIAEIGFNDVDEYKCIKGIDIALVLDGIPMAKDLFGLVVFHLPGVNQSAIDIVVNGPIKSQELGCVENIAIRQSKAPGDPPK